MYLLPKLTYFGGAACQGVINRYIRSLRGEDGKPREMTDEDQESLGVLLGKAYLEHQVAGWSCDTPFSIDALLSDWTIAGPVAEKADDLYSDAVLGPLAKAVAAVSPAGQTARSTSRRKRSTSATPRP